jgi:single-strand DNA-binding protein
MANRSLNKVMLIGNIARDPELRYIPSGTAVCSFSVATNRSWTPSDGSEKREETEFHRVVAWNKLAELCSQLLTKGRKVYIEGRLQTRSWETPEGGKRYSTEIVAEDMVLLDSKRVIEEAGEVSETHEAEKENPPTGGEELAEEVKPKEEAEKKSPKKKGKEEKEEKSEKEKGKDDNSNDEIDIDDIPF